MSFPFGHGLSYTTFALGELRVEVTGSVEDGDLSAVVSVSVTNTGETAGAEVVQAYVGDVTSEVARPVRELKGFAKVDWKPGETKQVELTLDQRAFSFWSVRWGRWAVEAGEFEIGVGTSSRDLPLRSGSRGRPVVGGSADPGLDVGGVARQQQGATISCCARCG